ncbi:hypothetical protein Plim_4207 [Planctopirus limnophila DSM 3776]|uniref:Uncharacterized protein n=1 Tax=Planctopirus limnophila (strain ATCC 43296 / DSM 3776 / IFAM 1008 / Mu 290) TaxID=521674 RepID=D5SZB4_PLAL2|nr:hypothetical protein Plim_4207 [Planctopirus limnophila DSM 3776]
MTSHEVITARRAKTLIPVCSLRCANAMGKRAEKRLLNGSKLSLAADVR